MILSDLLHFLRFCPTSNLESKGEGAICAQLRSYLTEETLTGKCNCVWFHPQNEGNKPSKHGWRFWNFQRNIGKFAGVSDYIFLGDKFCLCLEIKDGKKNKQEKNQKIFEQWCNQNAVPYLVASSFEEAITIIKEHGIVI